jgi:hypothetical protein
MLEAVRARKINMHLRNEVKGIKILFHIVAKYCMKMEGRPE